MKTGGGGGGGVIVPRVKDRIKHFEAMEEFTKRDITLGDKRIKLKISLPGTDNTYLNTKGFIFKKIVIKPLPTTQIHLRTLGSRQSK